MRINKTGVAVGLAVGVLAGGAGGVLAATGGTTTPPTAPLAGLGPGHGGMYGMMRSGQRPVLSAAASYLGVSQTSLRTEMQSGKTLADIAKAQGKSVSGLQDAITAAAKAHLDANSALTAEQKASITAQMKDRLSTMINQGHQPGAGRGMMGAQMGGMWR
jgi:hypothetical protein